MKMTMSVSTNHGKYAWAYKALAFSLILILIHGLMGNRTNRQ